jgi:K+/H+ antiporter YhaU regulatory subunit KhtT
MDITLLFEFLTKNLPTSISVTLSLFAIGIAAYLKFKQVDVDEKTSLSSIHAKQVESLMEQIELLSDELAKTREQLTNLHEQNISLMEELRNANRRIGELEILIDKRSEVK